MIQIEIKDSAHLDAFQRLRTSAPTTIFDSKQLFDSGPLFWDDVEVSGSGTGSTHSTALAASTMTVSADTAGVRTRQTFQSFNYQPGKSQLILMTGILDAAGGGAGITRRIGQFNDDNGVFFEDAEGTPVVVIRSSASGSAVDTAVARTDWNIDTMDGNGKSGCTVDLTKAQIFLIDYEWLGVGRVRFGMVVDGKIYYCHEANHANNIAMVYMSSPNLPLRYEIINDGTGAASSLIHICTSVVAEGGQEKNGALFAASTGGTHVDANAANSIYAVVGIRLKSTHFGATVRAVQIAMMSETADDFEWSLYWNPTVAGTFTYSDVTNAAVQSATGATENTVTNGTLVACGWSTSSSAMATAIESTIRLGATIGGTADQLVLCVRPLSSNADIQGSLTWREDG